MTTNNPKADEMITDFCGNTYPASALNEQESPGFDVHGARKDRAMQALPGIIAEATKDLAKVGDRVEVTGGRKHKGKVGLVFWRGVDQFSVSRYGSELQRTMSRALGHNDRVGVKTDSGEKFFVRLMDTKKI